MTTAQAVGAVSDEAAKWYAIDWPTIHRNVRRLQVRIAQATKERRWGKVQALQRLLTSAQRSGGGATSSFDLLKRGALS
jgi:RNA-directed DNA polymerase